MRRYVLVISALAVAALAAVALAATPFEKGNNPAQDCKNDPGPPAGRDFGECVSTKARALQDAAARGAATKARAAVRAARAKTAGESQRKAPFAKGDNPAQHCKSQAGPPTGRAFGECVSDYARSLNPSAGKPESVRPEHPQGAPQGPPAERPQPRAPESAPQASPPQGPPSDTPAGPPEGVPGPPSGGPPEHP
jgi:hypothetical protein